ncbi:hypothetical protein IMZ48_48655 [Candidatus Bathyarchaeota archaeon]|nr:hypothetical protein [Candidatus Bathyarchaeota archaeon]
MLPFQRLTQGPQASGYERERSSRGYGSGGASSSSSQMYRGVGGSSSSDHHRHRRAGGSSSSNNHRHDGVGGHSSSGGQRPTFSFLFVVNKLILEERSYAPERDRWGNTLPPNDRRAYAGEEPSRVMRYRDGRVTLAEGYDWHRPHGLHTRGCIFRPSGLEGPRPNRYKTQTVFSCNPFLPIVATPADMMAHDMDSHNGPQWDLLRFEHDPRHPGVSFAAYGQEGRHESPRQYVAGVGPSWIPSLVPESYLNPYNDSDSRGLGGDLPLLLALMSFGHRWTTRHDARMEEVFYGRDALWRDRRWWGDPEVRPEGCKSSFFPPAACDALLYYP